MKRLVLASCAALLVLAPVLVLAQNRTPPAGSTSVGSAAPRGGESSGSSSSGSASSGGSMGSAGSAGGSFSGSSPASGSTMRSYDGPRSGDAMTSSRTRNASASTGQPVPASERPRGDAPTIGQAIARTSRPPQSAGGTGVPGGYWGDYPYYGSYGWYASCGYRCSPYFWDYYPWYGWGMYSFPMSMYSAWAYPGYDVNTAGPAYTTAAIGSIKFKVKPKEAEVYVDGTYYGQVDNYDGTFQHLDLSPGTHHVEIRAAGFQSIQLELRVLPGKTITYTGEMKPAK